MSSAIRITVVSDVVCPWCYIGLQRLDEALALWSQRYAQAPAPEVRWEPFQLNPDMPLSGMPRAAYEQRKFGAQRAQVMARIDAAAREVGLAIDWPAIVRQPNTLALHAVIELAHTHGVQTATVRRLFEGFFVTGVDMGEPDEVIAGLQGLGLDPVALAACWELASALRLRVGEREDHWRGQGVSGVPLFVFNERWAVSGAQAPEQLLAAMLACVQDS